MSAAVLVSAVGLGVAVALVLAVACSRLPEALEAGAVACSLVSVVCCILESCDIMYPIEYGKYPPVCTGVGRQYGKVKGERVDGQRAL